MAKPGVFVLQINLTDVTKRLLQITARLDTDRPDRFASNLKLICEELWHCHDDGITVYDCQWNKLRKIRPVQRAMSVAALDTQNVVIATYRGLIISSTSGMIVQVIIRSAYFVYMTVFALFGRRNLYIYMYYDAHCLC